MRDARMNKDNIIKRKERKELVIDQEDKRILNAISENWSNFIIQRIEDTKDIRWNF